MGDAGEADFRAWVVDHRGRLRTTAYLLCGDWYLADDLVQEALGRLFARWGKVAAAGEVRPYVNRILYNLCIDHRRRPDRRELSEADVGATRPHPEVVADERDDELIAALHAIPAGQRAVLVLRFFEDLTVAQAAALLRTSAGNVKSQTSRGLAALRVELQSRQSTSEGQR